MKVHFCIKSRNPLINEETQFCLKFYHRCLKNGILNLGLEEQHKIFKKANRISYPFIIWAAISIGQPTMKEIQKFKCFGNNNIVDNFNFYKYHQEYYFQSLVKYFLDNRKSGE